MERGVGSILSGAGHVTVIVFLHYFLLRFLLVTAFTSAVVGISTWALLAILTG